VTKSWVFTGLLGGLAALGLGAAATAQDAAPPAFATDTVEASQAGLACAPRFAPAGARCTVEGSTLLGETLRWAFYEVRSGADRHGVSVLMAPSEDLARLRIASSLTVSAAALDRWKKIAYAPAGVFKHGDTQYAGMAVRGTDGMEAFSLSRIEADGSLTPVDAARLPAELQAKVGALTRPGCRVTNGGMDWRLFRIRQGMMGDEGSCGTLMIDLAVVEGAVTIADALVIR
jgi:hypothetical protein